MPTHAADFELAHVIQTHHPAILDAYMAAQQNTRTSQLLRANELRQQCLTVLEHLQHGQSYDANDPLYGPLRQFLTQLSRTRALQGFTPSETAIFIFSLKEALLPALQETFGEDPVILASQVLAVNRLLDSLGLMTFETYSQSREQLIREQSEAILELSTPVVQLWEGVLALPIIGAIDTARTQQIMESMLTRIVETGSSMVIIDITGVPVVDTAVAKHLLQTVAAARLLGAETVIVGISARIAQTLVHLGVDLSEVVTRTSMAKGLEYSLARLGCRIIKGEAPVASREMYG